MRLGNQSRNIQEQLLYGKISYSSALMLTRLAYLVSKRRLIEFYLPVLVLIIVVLAGSYFLLNEGREPTDYIGIPIVVLAFFSWYSVRFYWSAKGGEYLEWVEHMFGPKTRDRVLEQFLSGERYDVIQAAKKEGEYASSRYCMALSPDRVS
ncbi:hypothetical protein [Pseudomonas sp. PS02290]|uniref:hypothetical protein n=1 Tax=Pseudomonas sp. PS02290 TaxID=2991430 RepID=UPI00249CE89A|nr:hypothetical protein [Pseudomonas sp. PS02290]